MRDGRERWAHQHLMVGLVYGGQAPAKATAFRDRLRLREMPDRRSMNLVFVWLLDLVVSGNRVGPLFTSTRMVITL